MKNNINNKVFVAYDSEGNETIRIDEYGNASFKGHITGKKETN
ncbi:hypothetical protein [Lysinibacillus sp. Bpr_S20]|nr:hypothetical protein [Lysinibacillus sp. Bpr_S20]